MFGIKGWINEISENTKLQVEFSKLVPSLPEQRELTRRLALISKNVQCAHNSSHVMSFIIEILSIPPETEGCIVEAGCFKGGSAAKFSIFTKKVGRQFVLFDSFEGLPENQEEHAESVQGHSIKDWFRQGNFAGTLDEVRHNVTTYGEIDGCEFIKGWFDDTLPQFNRPVVAAYLDVDLASSTRTCLKYLYPLMVPGGAIYSQDGDFPLVIDVFNDEQFWLQEVGSPKPEIESLVNNKIIRVRKPLKSAGG
jgi:O-methyltransferase